MSAAEHCPACGAAIRLAADRCWLCGARLSESPANQVADGIRAANVIDATLVSQETAATFSLTSLFLVMTLAAVAAGVFAAAPWLGILFLVIALPALVRTMLITSRRKVRGQPATPRQRVLAFVESSALMLGYFVAICGSLVIALFSACSGGLIFTGLSIDRTPFFSPLGAVGGLLALVAIGCKAWTFWQAGHRRAAARKDRPAMTGQSRKCPECDAENSPLAGCCWLCGASFAAKATEASAEPQPPGEAPTSTTFSLSTLFLVMTLAAVAAGAFAAAPGLGIVFLVVATPALVRTMVVTTRQQTASGAAITPGKKVIGFFGSVGVVLALIVSIQVALFIACWAGIASGAAFSLFGESAMIVGGVGGGLSGLVVCGWILIQIWRRQKIL